ncbi:hypothetical protein BH23VER1_BH23VER1_09970 [soil metagenome]
MQSDIPTIRPIFHCGNRKAPAAAHGTAGGLAAGGLGRRVRDMRLIAVTLAVLIACPPAGVGAELADQLATAGGNAGQIRGFVDGAAEAHGAPGAEAATFLVEGMPASDLRSLSKEFLLENLALAMKARVQFPWARQLPEEVFWNDVLPYASLDETRESWRKAFFERCEPLVRGCETAGEAAQVINREIFDLIQVHYDTGRKAPNQSPSESERLGKATCTGLSVILVDACRSVGVAARVAGTALWSNKRGNHTWVEIYDDGEWSFTGADEYDAKGLNREKLQSVTTKTAPADLNDMATLHPPAGSRYRLRVVNGPEERHLDLPVPDAGDVTKDVVWDELEKGSVSLAVVKDWLALLPEERHLSVPKLTLSKHEAAEATDLVWQTLREEHAAARSEEIDTQTVSAAGLEMRYLEKTFGAARAGERPLFISMHGGGGAPPEVNDRQWRNQIELYAPEEGIVVAPRAPTNTWNLWHEAHIDALFDRLIENYVVGRGADPDRVYLMGYSAGGDGVYQLAPRMADRFAAASMMAGHPNDARPLGLRNLPFMIFMGGDDRAYHRNEVAAEWGERLAALQSGDLDGYRHKVTIYEGLGHWMDGRDAEALPWMSERTRDPWPRRWCGTRARAPITGSTGLPCP